MAVSSSVAPSGVRESYIRCRERRCRDATGRSAIRQDPSGTRRNPLGHTPIFRRTRSGHTPIFRTIHRIHREIHRGEIHRDTHRLTTIHGTHTDPPGHTPIRQRETPTARQTANTRRARPVLSLSDPQGLPGDQPSHANARAARRPRAAAPARPQCSACSWPVGCRCCSAATRRQAPPRMRAPLPRAWTFPIEGHYGRSIGKSFFFGCSNGGRQALMEAQRYPGDFDGIVAGAPWLNWTGQAAAFIAIAQNRVHALDPSAAGDVRLFMIPGAEHCTPSISGPGSSPFPDSWSRATAGRPS